MKKTKTDPRTELVFAACQDERIRFNKAIQRGARVVLHTFSGDYQVKYVDADWRYHTDGNGGHGQSWCGANDGTWDNLMKQADCKRDPLFESA